MRINRAKVSSTETFFKVLLEKWKTGGRNRYTRSTCPSHGRHLEQGGETNVSSRTFAIVRFARKEFCSTRGSIVFTFILESFFLQLRSIFGNEKKSDLRRRNGYEGRKKAISFFYDIRTREIYKRVILILKFVKKRKKETKKKEMTSKRNGRNQRW